MSYQAILFDLDGTLLDSAVHFHSILNEIATEAGYPIPSQQKVRSWASNGAAVMISECLGIDNNNHAHTLLCERFLERYDHYVHDSCPLFEGIQELLIQLSKRALPIGIITNKGHRFYQHIEPQISAITPVSVGITRDDVTEIKPHPEGLIKSAQQVKVNPKNCLYIVDHQRDIEAAKNAGMPSAVALWGYLQPGDQPEKWDAEHLLNTPEQLLAFLDN
jgi:phosphoglycolate phosphatase